jgi:hypothetical protein
LIGVIYQIEQHVEGLAPQVYLMLAFKVERSAGRGEKARKKTARCSLAACERTGNYIDCMKTTSKLQKSFKTKIQRASTSHHQVGRAQQ